MVDRGYRYRGVSVTINCFRWRIIRGGTGVGMVELLAMVTSVDSSLITLLVGMVGSFLVILKSGDSLIRGSPDQGIP